MRYLMIVILFVLSACGGGGPLDGNWIQIASDGSDGVAFNINGNNYVLAVIEVTSSASVNMQKEAGTITWTNTTLTLTPTESSCPGSDPARTWDYAIVNGSLQTTESAGALIFQPNTAQASTNLSIAYGCFLYSQGAFMPYPLTPVNN